MITTWGHDPGIVSVSNVLLALNDALSHSAVLVQVSLHHYRLLSEENQSELSIKRKEQVKINQDNIIISRVNLI